MLDKLLELKDEKYADFQGKLTPTVPREKIIGVRVPLARSLAKKYAGTEEAQRFIEDLPHDYYDENMLHGLLISDIKDYDLCIREVDRFLPYVDNWAVCDIMSPKVFKKHKKELLEKIYEWSGSDEIYKCRFGIVMLMRYFLDEDFKPEYLEIPAGINSDEYYIQMAIAWFFATALAKQWDDTIVYFENNVLSTWVHNKSIQKACESYRVTPEQKQYLRTLKK